jgi:hypothetical protein
MSDYPEIEANTAREALHKHLQDTKRGNLKFKRSGGNDVIFKTTPFREENGKKVRTGKDSWWQIVYNA